MEVSGDSRDSLQVMLISKSTASRELSKLTVTTIDMSNIMRKQTRVIEAMASQSLMPVTYSYSVSAASTGFVLSSNGFSGSEDSDIFGSLSPSVVLSEMTPWSTGCLSSFSMVEEAGPGDLSPVGKREIQATMTLTLVSSHDMETIQEEC